MKSCMSYLFLLMIAMCGCTKAHGTSACLDVIDARFRILSKPDRKAPISQIQDVVDACSVGDKVVWKKLRETLTDDNRYRKIRQESIRIARVIVDEEIGRDLLGIMNQWIHEARSAAAATEFNDTSGKRWYWGHTGKHGDRIILLGVVTYKGLSWLQAVMDDCGPVFSFTVDFYEMGFAYPPRNFHWSKVLGACHGPVKQRQEFALTMLRDYPTISSYASVVSLDDPSFREALRNLFRETASNQQMGGRISAGAVATLAYLGDEEILNDLKALREPFKDNPTMRLFIKQSIQKIEMQHPPKKLLGYIASDEDPYADVRAWAIERAVELGLPKSEIRDSILARAQHCKILGLGPRPNMRPEMVQLRRLGISLGVLKAYDLPLEDVPLSLAVD